MSDNTGSIPSAAAALTQRTLELDRAHVFHSWTAQAGRQPFVIESGAGSTVWDFEGRRYLDFSCQQVNSNVGHQHPRVLEAIARQAATITMVAPPTANLTRGMAAAKILEKAGPGFAKVFFTNGGADANENAIRMARLKSGRDKIVSTYRSYHGGTGAAIVATGDWRRMPNEYAIGHVHAFGPYLYRSEFWADSPEQEAERALRHLARVIESEGPDTVAAVLLETIPGTAGVLIPPPGYLEGVRALTARYGIALILDEVMAGFGRTGEWFGFHGFGVVPDLVTFAKGVNSGYVPAGGVLVSDEFSAYFDDHVFVGGLTYSGHPLAMAAIVGAIDAMSEERIVENAAAIGRDVLTPGLAALAAAHPSIGEARGVGVFHALEFVTDRETREPAPAPMLAAIKGAIIARGVLPFVVDNRVHVVPPCIVTADEARAGLAAIDDALTSLSL